MRNPKAEELLEMYEANGAEPPEELYPPPMMAGVADWVNAFWELSSDRQIGMSQGPIPSSSIARYAEGWDDVERELFRYAMRRADGVFLAHVSGDKPAPPPTKTMGPEMFDAMFGGKT